MKIIKKIFILLLAILLLPSTICPQNKAKVVSQRDVKLTIKHTFEAIFFLVPVVGFCLLAKERFNQYRQRTEQDGGANSLPLNRYANNNQQGIDNKEAGNQPIIDDVDSDDDSSDSSIDPLALD